MKSGILFPLSSFPSKHGIGDLGKEAYKVIDQLAANKGQYLQILPFHPSTQANSPYRAVSTYAGDEIYINLNSLVENGLLDEVPEYYSETSNVDYDKIRKFKHKYLLLAYNNFKGNDQYDRFLTKCPWVFDYALYCTFASINKSYDWASWPTEFKDYPKYHQVNLTKYTEQIAYYQFVQFIFYHQWFSFKKYANDKGIKIIGDMPFYVDHGSVEVWLDNQSFLLDEAGYPTSVAGVPPDYFSPTGQYWGNPLYDWGYHEKTGYEWWIRRMEYSLRMYDVVRVDHFRGFESYYSIPYGDGTAEFGHWEKGPGMALFQALEAHFGDELPVIAEDLGFLTDSVRELLAESGYPGMKVLQFAFDESGESVYLPFRYDKNCIVYTGTHDNETTKGWLGNLTQSNRAYVNQYTACEEKDTDECVWGLIRAAQSAVAEGCVVPLQDYLCLGNEARMNTPSTLGDNGKWRLTRGQLTDEIIHRINAMTRLYGRIQENKK